LSGIIQSWAKKTLTPSAIPPAITPVNLIVRIQGTIQHVQTTNVCSMKGDYTYIWYIDMMLMSQTGCEKPTWPTVKQHCCRLYLAFFNVNNPSDESSKGCWCLSKQYPSSIDLVWCLIRACLDSLRADTSLCLWYLSSFNCDSCYFCFQPHGYLESKGSHDHSLAIDSISLARTFFL
jgi:hypothetical protein